VSSVEPHDADQSSTNELSTTLGLAWGAEFGESDMTSLQNMNVRQGRDVEVRGLM